MRVDIFELPLIDFNQAVKERRVALYLLRESNDDLLSRTDRYEWRGRRRLRRWFPIVFHVHLRGRLH